ncbi:hypothetical protein BC834DRAFT_976699 [Gloeopeniophorella convolvens]|nr:hypothetical protein BC834DRAFT_976699 [Gloeopeniophorella convolvens]
MVDNMPTLELVSSEEESSSDEDEAITASKSITYKDARWIAPAVTLCDDVYTICRIGVVICRLGLGSKEANAHPLVSPLSPADRNKVYLMFLEILKHVPGLEDFVCEDYNDAIEADVFRAVSQHHKNARSDHTNTMRRLAPTYVTLDGKPVIDHGLNDAFLRELFIPGRFHQRYRENPDEVTQDFKDGTLDVTLDDLPLFLWEDYKFDPADPLHGLFESSLLKRCWILIFFGPCAAQRPDMVPEIDRGIARRHGMTNVTPRSIAYVACHVLLALSSKETWSQKDVEEEENEGFAGSMEQASCSSLHEYGQTDNLHYRAMFGSEAGVGDAPGAGAEMDEIDAALDDEEDPTPGGNC